MSHWTSAAHICVSNDQPAPASFHVSGFKVLEVKRVSREIVGKIYQSPLFANIAFDDLFRILNLELRYNSDGRTLKPIQTFPINSTLIEQGSLECDTFFIPISGAFSSITAFEDGSIHEVKLDLWQPFWDLAFYDGAKRISTVKAMETSIAIVFHREILELYPNFFEILSKNMQKHTSLLRAKLYEESIRHIQRERQLLAQIDSLQTENYDLKEQLVFTTEQLESLQSGKPVHASSHHRQTGVIWGNGDDSHLTLAKRIYSDS